MPHLPIKDVVIIGAGISGLATAYHLDRSGLDILLLEKSARTGGNILSETVSGFTIDYGPNSIVNTPEVEQLIQDIGLHDRQIHADPRAKHRYILKQGRLLPIPRSPWQFLNSKLLSIQGKSRLLFEPFISHSRQTDESIAAFSKRRFGKDVLDFIVSPLIAGIYAGDPSRLSIRSALPKLHQLECRYGSILKGLWQAKNARSLRTSKQMISFRSGMHELTQSLSTILSKRIQSESILRAIRINHGEKPTYHIHYTHKGESMTLTAKTVIFTTPAYVSIEYLKSIDPLLTKTLHAIPYAPISAVFLGFNPNTFTCRSLDGFGFLVPKREARHILGSIWNSSLFPHRAPKNGIALTSFVGGIEQGELTTLSDEKLSRLVLHELEACLHLKGKPEIIRIKTWPKAIPQYELGHHERLQCIQRFESQYPGLFISGNFRHGLSVGDCLINAHALYQKIIDRMYH